VELSAVPEDGFRFAGWSDGCQDGPTIPTCTLPALARDVQITARFVPVVSLEVAVRGRGEVRTVAAEHPQSCTATCTFTVDLGERIALRAVPARRAQFERWSGRCRRRDGPRCKVSGDADDRVVAVFSPKR
jgi:hypothetical protein